MRAIDREKLIAANRIIVSVGAERAVPIPAMLGAGRRKDIVRARDEAIRLIYNSVGLTSVQIGTLFNRHHTTILAAFKRAPNMEPAE